MSDEGTEGPHESKELHRSREEQERKWREEDVRWAGVKRRLDALLKKVQDRDNERGEDDSEGVPA
jgi:hypothetical protein